MASIPLPALQARTPDNSEGMMRMAQLAQMLKMAPGQMQLQQQQVQAGQQENALREQQIRDQKASTEAWKQWDGKNTDAITSLVLKNGGSSAAALNVTKMIRQNQAEALDLVSKQGAEAKRQADLMLGAKDVLDKAKPEERPGMWGQVMQGLQSQGVDISRMPQQYPGDDGYKVLSNVVQLHTQNIDQAFKQAEAAKNTAQAGEAEARTREINAKINPQNPADPQIQAQKYQGILQTIQTQGIGAVTPADLQWARAHEAAQKKTTTQSDSLGVSSVNTSGPSGLAAVGGRAKPAQGTPSATPSGTPARPGAPTSAGSSTISAKESTVDMIGNYKMSPQLLSRLMYRHPDIIGEVGKKYPDWSQINYDTIHKAILDLAPSGKTGQGLTSYNTFLRHAGALYDAVDSLDNSKYSDLLNKPLNWLAQHTGDPRVADFMAAMQPPMKEFQSFLLNNRAMHEEDVKDAHSLIDQNKTPQEIRAVLKRFAETGSARLSELNESFKRVTGRDIPNLVSPEAAKAYNKITGTGGNGVGVIYARDPQGNLHRAPAGTPLPQGWTQENK